MYIYIYTQKYYTYVYKIIYIPQSSPRALFPPLSKRHKISAPRVDFSPLARFLPLAFLGIDMKRNLPFNHWRNGLGEPLAEAFALEACCFTIFFPNTTSSKVDMSAHGARSQHTFTARTWLESSILNPSTSYVWQAIFVKSTQTSVLSNLSLPP